MSPTINSNSSTITLDAFAEGEALTAFNEAKAGEAPETELLKRISDGLNRARLGAQTGPEEDKAFWQHMSQVWLNMLRSH